MFHPWLTNPPRLLCLHNRDEALTKRRADDALFDRVDHRQNHAIRSQRVENNAVGAIFAQPQVAAIIQFKNAARELRVVKIPTPEERGPLRQTLEVAHQMFPTNATAAAALAMVEDWDGRTGRAQELRENAAHSRPAPKLAGEASP